MRDLTGELERNGYALVPGVLATARVESLKQLFSVADVARAERQGQTYGARNLLSLREVRDAANAPSLRVLLDPLLGAAFQAVRGLFFDKTESANWPVLWHQDLSLAVKQRHDLPGWTNWSVKRDVQHVQPPANILARMVTVRLHLDDCPADNGPLKVIPGSHSAGLLSRDAIRDTTSHAAAEAVIAQAGDALLMRPLILHSSSPAARPRHRRVLHLEFAPPGLLPCGLDWADAA